MKKNLYHQELEIVTRQFEDQVELYSHNNTDAQSEIVSFLKKKLKTFQKNTSPLKICEFGGGGGDLLATIERSTQRKLELYNSELVQEYKKHQAHKHIHFLNKSLLDSKMKDNTFDIVMVRNVIHHLVNTSLQETRKNQQHAICELVRITKPGGLILIDEQVNNSSLACTLFFRLSWVATKLKIRFDAFQVTPNTIVGYLMRNELIAYCDSCIPQKKWLENSFFRWAPQLHWKLTMLMNDTGAAFIAMKKPL